MEVSLFSPAKINLFLAVTSRRADGFHDLLSVAAPLDFGDDLKAVASGEITNPDSQFTLECSAPGVPLDGGNLVLKAATAFAAATGWKRSVHFQLTKRIPTGAGLGGGSSNAVAALRALNRLSGELLDESRMNAVAASLGSDCALFLRNAPVVMRGRGERVASLPESATERLRGRQVLLFKPSFCISTPWAYGRMVARGTDYLPEAEAETRFAKWLEGKAPAEALLFNNMEPAAFDKYVALPVLLKKLREKWDVAVAMSGSGSACYALLRGDDRVAESLSDEIRACWGAESFVQRAALA
jgi:4-diphosphocytidyl-2-C-methyl-D-erythritol kinase